MSTIFDTYPKAFESRRVSILGVTGSIGTNALEVLRAHPERFSVEAITANNHIDKLVALAKEFKPRFVAIADEAYYLELKDALASYPSIQVGAGRQAIIDAAKREVDIVLAAIVGMAGLEPILASLPHTRYLALANKEALVAAGPLLLKEAKRYQATIIPVDSEHSAISQVFHRHHQDQIESITLTASGGPFRNFTPAELIIATPEQALRHPNWKMGDKITVDSATMMNKGLEIIEAYYLFPVEPEHIHVIVHPESIVHGMVTYRDGSVLAQLGLPSMVTPISLALAWPERIALPGHKLDLSLLGSLHFEDPDPIRFPCLDLARQALNSGPIATTVLNSANEIAVWGFLQGMMGFMDIPALVSECLADDMPTLPMDSLDDILEIDKLARRNARLRMERVRQE